MQETNPRRKKRLSGKGHIRLREQLETDDRYPIRNAIAGYSTLASITNIPGRPTGPGQIIFHGYYGKLMDYTGALETRSWAAM
jgi:hypothetical protein